METTVIKNQSIILGDCLEGLRKVPEKYFDACITSPPYNLNKDYRSYNDSKVEDEYITWLNDIFIQVHRTLRDNGHVFLNLGETSKTVGLPHRILSRILPGRWTLQNTIIWVKSLTVVDKSFGHFKPITSKRYLNNTFEYIFHITKDGKQEIDRLGNGVPFMCKSNIKRFGKNDANRRDVRCRGNVWYIPYETVKSQKQKFNHPCIFPTALPTMCLKMIPTAKVIVDPFVGSGSTLVACKKLGISGVGYDIDSSYVDITKERLSD